MQLLCQNLCFNNLHDKVYLYSLSKVFQNEGIFAVLGSNRSKKNMKNIIFLFFLFVITAAKAGTPYHNYLLSQAHNIELSKQTNTQPGNEKSLTIPRYHIPSGSVFCRLEDKLTRATKVWVKIGVQ